MLAGPINANDLLVALISTNDSSTTVTDTSSNVWTLLGSPINQTTIAYCLNAAQAASLTVTQTGTSSLHRYISVDQFTPQGRATLLQTANAQITTSVSSGNCGSISGD